MTSLSSAQHHELALVFVTLYHFSASKGIGVFECEVLLARDLNRQAQAALAM
jgi:hypothetical protein